LESGFVALIGSQQSPVASCDTWFLKGFYPFHSTFTPSQGSASRSGCTWYSVQAAPRRRNKGLRIYPRTICKGKGVAE